MGNVAELKKALTVGRNLKAVYRFREIEPENRVVTRIKSNGVYLRKPNGKESFLDIPKTNLITIDDIGFIIFCAGVRELSPKEKEIIANEPKDEKQEKIDMMGDGSQMFWLRKKYYAENNAEYLNHKKQRGMYYLHGENKVEDESVRGKPCLIYQFVKGENK